MLTRTEQDEIIAKVKLILTAQRRYDTMVRNKEMHQDHARAYLKSKIDDLKDHLKEVG